MEDAADRFLQLGKLLYDSQELFQDFKFYAKLFPRVSDIVKVLDECKRLVRNGSLVELRTM